MAITNKSNTANNEKDYWRTSPELISDALKLLGIEDFNTDVCCADHNTKIDPVHYYISEKNDALQGDCWFLNKIGYQGIGTSFCNPPFSRKWEFFQKAIEQSKQYESNVLMVLPYTPCTKEWANNVHGTDCIIYVPDGRYQYLLPDGSKPRNSCNFETCLVLIVPFKCGNVIVNYKRGCGDY